jgi:hypothetical protein
MNKKDPGGSMELSGWCSFFGYFVYLAHKEARNPSSLSV